MCVCCDRFNTLTRTSRTLIELFRGLGIYPSDTFDFSHDNAVKPSELFYYYFFLISKQLHV